MADRDLNRELEQAVGDEGDGDRQPLAILRRLGVSLPPTLQHDVDSALPSPGESQEADAAGARLEVPALGMDVWAGQDRMGFAPTLDIEDAGARTTGYLETVSSQEQIGRYVVVGELGSGGMGRVVEALDRDLGRRLAIKVVRDPGRLTEARLARFVAEAQLTAQLEHPHIVPVHELGVTDRGQLYYAMKKVDGVSLAEVLLRINAGDKQLSRRWNLRRLLGAFVKVCLAAGYAHRRGVVHRDLKPDNIMLGEFGEVLLLDWGLARLVSTPDEPLDEDGPARPDVTRDGAATGTPGYLSPEQARGERAAIGPPTDVWSLGSILYEILTGATPFPGRDPLAYLRRVVQEDAQDPRDRAPHRQIPADLAAICLRALDREPGARQPDGRDLAHEIEEWLEGARRRTEAMAHIEDAARWWEEFRAAREQTAAEEEHLAGLEAQTNTWTPVAEKTPLLAARKRRDALQLAAARAWGEAVVAGERALAHDPGNKRARGFLARAYWARMEEAELRGDSAEQALYELRVRAYDDGPLRALLRGDGAVSLTTDPPGAEVVAQRYEDDGLRLRLLDPQPLGRTPLVEVPLAQGSWRLRLRLPGRPEVPYPLHIPRGGHWDASAAPVPLPAEVPEGFCYVPGGPARVGAEAGTIDALKPHVASVDSFFAAEEPVMVGEYLAFLDALHARDPEQAWARVPRQGGGLSEDAERYLARPVDGRYAVPEADAQGDTWDLRFPVFAISADDAEAYAAWRSEVTGRPHRLLTELEWEKAARGVDGRAFPWGNAREATFCWNRDAQAGRPQPQVLGTCADDVSPYGLRDVAGGVTEWTASARDDDHRICRGGSWASTLRQCELACRLTTDPQRVFTYLGFRLALDL